MEFQNASRMIPEAFWHVGRGFRDALGDVECLTASYLPGNQVDGLPGIAVLGCSASPSELCYASRAGAGTLRYTSLSSGHQVDGVPLALHILTVTCRGGTLCFSKSNIPTVVSRSEALSASQRVIPDSTHWPPTGPSTHHEN